MERRNTMKNPRIFVRPDDGEEFIEVRPGYFSVKKSIEDFPGHLHHEYPETLLREKRFVEKETLENENINA